MENWAKWTGTQFYRDYILPSNRGSKNVLIASVLGKKKVAKILSGKSRDEITDYCNNKLGLSKTFILTHTIGLLYILYWDIDSGDGITISTQVVNILVNLYPILVQIDKHQRVIRILEQLNNSNKT